MKLGMRMFWLCMLSKPLHFCDARVFFTNPYRICTPFTSEYRCSRSCEVITSLLTHRLKSKTSSSPTNEVGSELVPDFIRDLRETSLQEQYTFWIKFRKTQLYLKRFFGRVPNPTSTPRVRSDVITPQDLEHFVTKKRKVYSSRREAVECSTN